MDAHLRALAAEFEELQRASAGAGGEPSLASTAATQVQSILTAAETAAADIERQALAGRKRGARAGRAGRRAHPRGRVAQARAHVAAVAQATAVLLERVASMDGEVDALVESLRAGAGRLAGDLAAVETNMGELYDAAAGRVRGRAGGRAVTRSAAPPAVASSAFGPAAASAHAAPRLRAGSAAAEGLDDRRRCAAEPAPPCRAAEPVAVDAGAGRCDRAAAGANGDLDGARLIALNMALNGESRADADRYLAENFQLTDREKLIDEVYAAIEG